VIGTPFKSLELEDKYMEQAVFPLMDRERYNYLLKAINGVRNGKNLSEIRY